MPEAPADWTGCGRSSELLPVKGLAVGETCRGAGFRSFEAAMLVSVTYAGTYGDSYLPEASTVTSWAGEAIPLALPGPFGRKHLPMPTVISENCGRFVS